VAGLVDVVDPTVSFLVLVWFPVMNQTCQNHMKKPGKLGCSRVRGRRKRGLRVSEIAVQTQY
jgi:hypothetical protein